MALGGGNYLVQNKILPGTYINLISASKASVELSDRGIVALPMTLDWGVDGEVFTVESGDFQKSSLKLFGYSYTAKELRDIREVFKHARKVHFYRLNTGDKATVKVGGLTVTAKYSGTKGNDINIVVATNIDDSAKSDVSTYFGTEKIEVQTVAKVEDLVANDFVTFSGTGAFTTTAGSKLASGSNLSSVTGTQYQAALDAFESYSYHVLTCPVADSTTVDLFTAYTKRQRDEIGVKLQLVCYRKAADYEGVISVENTVKDEGANPAALVFWTSGLEASTAINKSGTNKKYDGEYTVDIKYTQSQLETNLRAGKFMFHKVNDSVNVLSDVNTFVSFTVEKSKDFSSNQVMRVLDQSANDKALLFNTKYLGDVQNDADGRVSLWNDFVNYNNQLQKIRAIEEFNSDALLVQVGTKKESVVVVDPMRPVTAMEKLYVAIIVQ
jgi:hypothetical protein